MTGPHEFRGNAHRRLAELNAWTKQRHEAALYRDTAARVYRLAV